ncbi:alpha/beta-hydrolase [Pyrenochaeta sp. DS3sAY3a]|nr:alpha/beta-hydrolase [Pyrenochaeta sp. DS3sAY3a]
MAGISNSFISTLRFNRAAPYLCLTVGAASLGSLVFWRAISRSSQPTATPSVSASKTIPSPRDTVLPYLQIEQINKLPYPPDALPGSRDVGSPFGSARIYEWGPTDGERVLLIHGISTPSIALTDLAFKLVSKGCRVMLFDLFGRGYSSGPNPLLHNYDSSLYAAQIFLCLQSSTIPWTQFSIIGYSLGGAIGADFTSYFPNLVKGLVLVAPGGLIRTKHINWKSKLLYQSRGWIPESLVEKMVGERLWTGPETARTIEPEPDTVENAETTRTRRDNDNRGNAVYMSSSHILLPDNPQSTVSAVVDWQIQHHAGFVPAFISSIRYAPVHDQHERWRVIQENIIKKEGTLRAVWLVLGETDPIIVADEVIEDVRGVLGEENVHIRIVPNVGHEVGVERADAIVEVMGKVLGRDEW